MRCPSCSKFPSFEIGEPETDSIGCDGGQVTGNIRLVLTTGCCGDEAKEANFDVELDMTDGIVDALKTAGVENAEALDLSDDCFSYDVTSEEATADDRYESTNPKTGKPIPSRYQKHFYCVELVVTVECTYKPKEGNPVKVTVEGSWKDEIQASGMDELV